MYPHPPLVLVLVTLLATPARADQQEIAPGTAQQDAVVIDTGANGLCETTAAVGDIQRASLGGGEPFRVAVRCGADKVVSSAAVSDDTQLVALGGSCGNMNTAVIDTGANGIADTTANNAGPGDDTQIVAVATAPANGDCVITGANGVADTAAAGGDDTLVLTPVGSAEPNSDVILCGPNAVADTTANNVNPAGDDVQVVAVSGACAANDVVVDSGPNGVADTRAEGPDLVLKVARAIKLSVGKGKASASKTIKVSVANVEFGASAPAFRTYRLSATRGSCPGGTVNQVDADAVTPGLQATASIPQGGRIRGSFVVTLGLEDVASVASNTPFRCEVNVDAIALDTDPDVDDAANDGNNSTRFHIDVTDKNDL